MVKWALLLSAVLLQSACSNRTEQAQETLKSYLGEKLYLEFQNIETFPKGAVCGEYRRSDPLHGSSRYHRFIVWGDNATGRPSEEEWAIFCTQDSPTALEKELGINPVANEENQLSKIRNDLITVQTALEQYLADNHSLPSETQGLTALITASSTHPVPLKFRDGGYLSAIPTDPWGRQYVYEKDGLSGVAPEFRLYTLGADGTLGGAGKNADVRLEHLKYLDYLDAW